MNVSKLVRITGSLVVAAGIASLTLISSGSAKAFTGTGTGTTNDPYMISSCDELQSIGEDAVNGLTENKTYKLSGNIDCAASSSWNGGAGFDPIDSFDGVFDGNNHTISNLTINRPGEDQIGLFGPVGSSSLVVRVKLTGVDIIGRNNVGGLAGEMNGTTAGNSVAGDVTGATTNYYYGVGGLFGRKGQSDSSISRSSFSGTVTNTGPSTGGLIGFGGNIGNVSNVYADATVNGQAYTGGLVGLVSACCNMLTDSYAVGSVTGSSNVGGIYGRYEEANWENIMTNVFAAAAVTGTSQVGAVFGSVSNIDPSPVTNVMFDETAAGTADCYGSSNATNLSCTAQNTDGLSTDYFYDKTHEPLASWNFTDTWAEQPSEYPTLEDIAVLTGPGVVQNVTGTFPDTPDQLQLNFDAPASLGSFPLRNYEAEVIEASGDWNSPIDSSTDSTASLTLGGFRLDTDYTARVRAITVYGASEWVEYNFTTAAAATFEIDNCEDLEEVDLDAYRLDTIVLTQDIDCSGITNFLPLSWEGDFGGTFEGNGFTISNLNIQTEYQAALFSYTEGAEMHNVNFSGGSIVADNGYAGALVGLTRSTNISNVHSNLDVEATQDGYAGGLIGFAENQSQALDMVLTDLSSSGDISGSDDVGGLIGEVENDEGKSLTISNSYATGDVSSTTTDEGYSNYGGLIGDVEAFVDDDDQDVLLTIKNSYATGDVSGPNSTGGLVGDLSAEQDGYDNATPRVEVFNTYASGDVSSDYTEAGGLIGNVEEMYDEGEVVTITNNFSAGTASAADDAYEGGLIGYVEPGDSTATVDNNYFDSSVVSNCTDEDSAAIGDCVGINESEQPDYFKNNDTNEPLNQWDFDDIWGTQPNGYPVHIDGRDLNGDSIPDNAQDKLSGYTSPITGKTVVIDVGEDCEVAVDDMTRESSLAVQDAGYDYANGLFDFEADCSVSTTTIKLYYYGVSIQDLAVRKFNPNTNAYFTIPGASLSQQTINGQSVAVATYEVTDGGTLDMDGEVNGSIKDPAGVGTLAVGAPNTGIGGRR